MSDVRPVFPHDVGAAYKAKRGKLISGHATRSVVQDHLVLEVGHVLIESLDEINATLRFHAGFGQESVQSRVIDGDVTILRAKAFGEPINAGDPNVTLIFNANHSHRYHEIQLSLVA